MFSTIRFYMFDPFLKEQDPPAAQAVPGYQCILFLQVGSGGRSCWEFFSLYAVCVFDAPTCPPDFVRPFPPPTRPEGGHVSESIRFRTKSIKVLEAGRFGISASLHAHVHPSNVFMLVSQCRRLPTPNFCPTVCVFDAPTCPPDFVRSSRPRPACGRLSNPHRKY